MKTMKTIIPKLIPLTFLLSQVLVACGPAGMEGYDEAYDEFYDEVSVEDASDSSHSSELRRGRVQRPSPKTLTCEDRGYDDYSQGINVVDEWNIYITNILSQNPSTTFTALEAGFEASFCPYNDPLVIWASGTPSCALSPAPQPSSYNNGVVSFLADASSNPAVIRYSGCVFKELEAELAEL